MKTNYQKPVSQTVEIVGAQTLLNASGGGPTNISGGPISGAQTIPDDPSTAGR